MAEESTWACKDFVPTAATREIEERLNAIGTSHSSIIVIWGSSGFGKTENLLHLKNAVEWRGEQCYLSFIQEPEDVKYHPNPPDDFYSLCEQFDKSHPRNTESRRWQLLLLDCNQSEAIKSVNSRSNNQESDACNNKAFPIQKLRLFLNKDFNTTIVLAAQRIPRELIGLRNVFPIQATTFNEIELATLIRKQTEDHRPGMSEHVENNLHEIYKKLKDCSPQIVRSELEQIMCTQNKDELIELLDQTPKSQQSKVDLQLEYQEFWMVVSYVKQERFTKDFLTWIIMVYQGMFGEELSSESTKRSKNLLEHSPRIANLMIKECKDRHLLKQVNVVNEERERSDCYFTMDISLSEMLEQRRMESGRQLKYFRVFMYALFHMIDKDLRFHLLKRDKPLEFATLTNIARNILQNADCQILAISPDTGRQLSSPEVEFQFYGLSAAVEYYELQSTADRGHMDVKQSIERFKRNVANGKRAYKKCNDETKHASCTLIKAVQRVHKFSNRDVITLKTAMTYSDLKPNPRQHQLKLLEQKEKDAWIDQNLLLREEICSEMYIGEIYAWILTVYGKILKKYRKQSPDTWGAHISDRGDQPKEIFDEARKVYDDLRTKWLTNGADLLQRVILIRDELILEIAEDPINRDTFTDLCIKELEDLTNSHAVKRTEGEMAYEYGVLRSDLRTDKYHQICCREKRIQIDRLYLDKTTDPLTADVVDDIIRRSSNEFSEIRKLICDTKDCGSDWKKLHGLRNDFVEENCRRMYAYCLEEAALLLWTAQYRKEAVVYYAYALDMLHKYFEHPNEALVAIVLKERKYIDMCQTIEKFETTPALDDSRSSRLPIGNAFTQCICWPISREGRDNCTQCHADRIATTVQAHGRECAFRIMNSLMQDQPAGEAASHDTQPTHENAKQTTKNAHKYLQQGVRPGRAAQN